MLTGADFLSAYYFNEGEFKTPNSGLTYYDHKGTLSAYKTHDRDPLFFDDGMKLVFRNSETTSGCGDTEHCPNQFCSPHTTPRVFGDDTAQAAGGEMMRDDSAKDTSAQYETLVWVYEWPKISAGGPPAAQAVAAAAPGRDVVALSLVAELAAQQLLTLKVSDIPTPLIGLPRWMS
jgi:hypothetical protein